MKIKRNLLPPSLRLKPVPKRSKVSARLSRYDLWLACVELFAHNISKLHEAEEHANETRRAAEIEAIVKQRIAEAVAETRATVVSRAVELVTFIRDHQRLSKSSEDGAAIQELASALQETDQSKLETTVGLFIAGQGDCKTLTVLRASAF